MKNKGNKYRTSCLVITSMSLLILIMVGATVSVRNSFHTIVNKVDKIYTKSCEEQLHIAFIVEDISDDFMKMVLKSVEDEARQQGIYVEPIGDQLTEAYTKQELLELAIAAKVDGIILEGDNKEETRKLIADAKEKHIPVVTIRSDCVGSERACFVGVNNYTLGHTYGNQILNLTYHKSKQDVIILLDQNNADSSQAIIYSSLCQTLEGIPGVTFNIRSVQIARELTFEAEEQIRNLFIAEELPEIVVCLNQLYTSCALQAIIDQNKVGKTKLIGFYDNEMIREAIQENVLQCSISIDTEQMGKCCVESLQDIFETGHVSEYTSVDTYLINKDTIRKMKV